MQESKGYMNIKTGVGAEIAGLDPFLVTLNE